MQTENNKMKLDEELKAKIGEINLRHQVYESMVEQSVANDNEIQAIHRHDLAITLTEALQILGYLPSHVKIPGTSAKEARE